jgi:hypothetical protein
MKHHTSFIIASSVILAFAGCSKHSPSATSPWAHYTDLGVVQVSNGGTNRVDMGGGRVCVVRSFIVKDGEKLRTTEGKEEINKGQKIVLMLTVEQTDSSGVTRQLASQNLMPSPDQTVGFSDGDIKVKLTPHLKP